MITNRQAKSIYPELYSTFQKFLETFEIKALEIGNMKKSENDNLVFEVYGKFIELDFSMIIKEEPGKRFLGQIRVYTIKKTENIFIENNNLCQIWFDNLGNATNSLKSGRFHDSISDENFIKNLIETCLDRLLNSNIFKSCEEYGA